MRVTRLLSRAQVLIVNMYRLRFGKSTILAPLAPALVPPPSRRHGVDMASPCRLHHSNFYIYADKQLVRSGHTSHLLWHRTSGGSTTLPSGQSRREEFLEDFYVICGASDDTVASQRKLLLTMTHTPHQTPGPLLHWHYVTTMFSNAYAACSLIMLSPPQTLLRYCRLDSGSFGGAPC
jgi:hypothetical protein